MLFATGVVRDEAGKSSLRDNNDYVFLPPSFSKVWLNKHTQKFKPICEWDLREGFYTTQEETDHSGGDVAQKWRNWTEDLNDYYRYPPSGLILVNHEFVFGDSDTPTKYKSKEYQNSDTAEEFDLLSTSRSGKICVSSQPTSGRRTLLTFRAVSGSYIPAPGLSAKKSYEYETKL